MENRPWDMIKSHQKEFDQLYSELFHHKDTIVFPLRDIDRYSWDRGAYGNELYSYFYRRFSIFILGLLDVEDSNTILNIGCGLGFEERNLIHLYKNLDIWSVDISHEMILKAAQNGCPSTVCLSLAEALPFADNSFDRILAREVIEHVLSPERMMKEVYRCLKPGGLAVITTEFKSSLAFTHLYAELFYRKWADFMGISLTKTPYKNSPLSPAEIKRLAQHSGLIAEKAIWDGVMYQWFGSLLFQKILRSKITRIADLFSRLENLGSLEKYFCDQIKFTFRKAALDHKEDHILKAINYRCPSCHGPTRESLMNQQCLSCGRIYPYIHKKIPNFIDYELMLADEYSEATRKSLGEVKEGGTRSKQTRRYVFKSVEAVLRGIYLFLIISMACIFVYLRIFSKRPRIERVLSIEKKLAEYLPPLGKRRADGFKRPMTEVGA